MLDVVMSMNSERVRKGYEAWNHDVSTSSASVMRTFGAAVLDAAQGRSIEPVSL
jgi:hypothetical protein